MFFHFCALLFADFVVQYQAMHIENWIKQTVRLQLDKSPRCNPFKFINDTSAIIKLNNLYVDKTFAPCENLSELRSIASGMNLDEISKIVYQECIQIGIIH